MDKITLASPGKINLYLEIIKKRPDGYHDIKTIYQGLDLHDNLTISLKKEKTIHISCQHPDVPCNFSNLAYKAAKILLNKLNIKCGLKININKKIPVAAGLGGGSSNAASVILGLNSLLKLNFKKKELLDMASKVGSDVPFFILEESCALGEGRGDKLKVIKNIPKLWYILINPQIKISSFWAYQNFKLNLTRKRLGVKICIRALRSANLENIATVLYNDLAFAIENKYKDVQDAKEALKTGGIKAVLVSGSGPCVFGVTQSRREAMQVKRKIDKRRLGWATFVCCDR